MINSIDDRVVEQEAHPKFAREVIVWMVVSPDFKIQVVYEPLNRFEVMDRAALMLEIIKSVEGIEVRIIINHFTYGRRTDCQYYCI